MANEKEKIYSFCFSWQSILFLIICLMPNEVPICLTVQERRTLLSAALVDSPVCPFLLLLEIFRGK